MNHWKEIPGQFLLNSCWPIADNSLEIRELIASGKWKMKTAEGFALFPGTDHIETVVVFDRIQPQPRNKLYTTSMVM